MTDGRRQLSLGSTGSVWGATHLGPDAIVAFVDDELAAGARRRALSHLAGCGECASEVVEQTQARIFLKASSVPSTPMSLLRSLRDIPSQAELPAAPAGLAVGPGGELVSMVRSRPVRQRAHLERRGLRVGAGAVVSGIALGALVLTGSQGSSPSPGTGGTVAPRDVRLQLGGLRDTADESLPAVGSRSSGTARFAHHRWYR
jgi:hypothetical protein